ncbi:MAG: RuBisCO accumulation factor 1, partial [Synechocystis sp.]
SGPKSDVLYELRILNQSQRAIAAVEAQQKNLTADEAKELAKAFQEFGYLSQLPEGFTEHPGDALAYQCWKFARQKKDITARTRLIVKGLKFAHSDSARTAIEQLLTDLTAKAAPKAPLVPIFRIEEAEESARLIPVAGTLPLTIEQLQQVETLTQGEPFGLVNYQGTGAIVPVPQWQAILTAVDPVAIFCAGGEVAETVPRKDETVMVIVDRGQRTWAPTHYFVVPQGEQLAIRWFETEPDCPILGQVVVVLRPKQIFDENHLREPWQMDD